MNDNEFDVMTELAIQMSGVDLVEAVAGDNFDVGIEDFDPASEIGMVLTGLDSMIPQDMPYVQDEEDIK